MFKPTFNQLVINTCIQSLTGAFSLRFIHFYYNSSLLELLGNLICF